MNSRAFGRPRRLKRYAAKPARNTDMELFKGPGGWYYVAVVSKFSSCWLHLLYNTKDPQTGQVKRFYIPCCKSVVVEDMDGEDEYGKSDDDCPGCEKAAADSGKGREALVYWPKLHHCVYLAVLGRTRDPRKEPEEVQQLYIWSFNDKLLESLELLGDIEPLKTRILIKADKVSYGGDSHFTEYTPHVYNGPKISISADLKAAYNEAKKEKKLEAYAKPPSYKELAKIIEEQEKKLKKGNGSKGFDDEPDYSTSNSNKNFSEALNDDDDDDGDDDLDDANIDAVLEEDDETIK